MGPVTKGSIEVAGTDTIGIGLPSDCPEVTCRKLEAIRFKDAVTLTIGSSESLDGKTPLMQSTEKYASPPPTQGIVGVGRTPETDVDSTGNTVPPPKQGTDGNGGVLVADGAEDVVVAGLVSSIKEDKRDPVVIDKRIGLDIIETGDVEIEDKVLVVAADLEERVLNGRLDDCERLSDASTLEVGRSTEKLKVEEATSVPVDGAASGVEELGVSPGPVDSDEVASRVEMEDKRLGNTTDKSVEGPKVGAAENTGSLAELEVTRIELEAALRVELVDTGPDGSTERGLLVAKSGDKLEPANKDDLALVPETGADRELAREDMPEIEPLARAEEGLDEVPDSSELGWITDGVGKGKLAMELRVKVSNEVGSENILNG
ncbi:hypothetical protein PVAG01_09827 [Phlyctema vagabunda]|uniref:Uncharacterized protein n=1 Tax=Phlyctema vagabunda TaxID=108571 RepID=A0ABR4P459_9HELO